MMIYEEYLKENVEWDRFIERSLGVRAQLIFVSRFSSNRRIYLLGDRIAKVRKITREPFKREQGLKGEFRLLSRLRDVYGVPQNPAYIYEDGWEALQYDYVRGKKLETLINERSTYLKIQILLRILKLIVSINRHSIAHRDTKPENIIVSEEGMVHLLDFDQAVEIAVHRAMLIDIFGIEKVMHQSEFSFRMLFQKATNGRFRFMRFFLRPFKIILRLFEDLSYQENFQSLEQAKTEDDDIKVLEQAWQIGRRSNANSPGQEVAYYSFDLADFHFHGERPWVFRWHEISKRVDFKGKRILELGCNLGLFSAFARRMGASKCVGVDRDGEILEGARLVSKALHVQNEFYQVDFDSDDAWEDKLRGFDLVIALSIVNWLRNKNRFLSFLGEHTEVLYEGHESIEVEFGRLRRAGFNKIELIMLTERDRPIFFVSKVN